jgi:prolyl-tRNA synthetase
MGSVVEVSHDERGIIWPTAIAPYQVYLVSLDSKEKEAQDLYDKLTKNGIEVIWDDRDETAGTKFGDADLIGVPLRVVVSNKSLEKNEIEIKVRKTGQVEMVKFDSALDAIKKLLAELQ